MAPQAGARRRKPPPRNNFFTRLQDWKLEDLFSRKRPPATPRTIYINQPLPDEYFGKKGKIKPEHEYTTNQVVTSKYTIITFLPRNLLEQFRRIANIFFAFIVILQFFPPFATISLGLVMLPLIVVLLITAIKDGYEDIKRHQSDRHVNHTRTHVLAAEGYTNPNRTGKKSKTFTAGIVLEKARRRRQKQAEGEDVEKAVPSAESPHAHSPHFTADEDDPDHLRFLEPDSPGKPHWQETIWEDVKVGDIVLLHADDSVPADILIIATSEEENVCFVETKNLDGETNLKSRHGISELSHLRNPEDFMNASFAVDVEAPHVNMYQLHGAVTEKESGKTVPLDMQTVLLRATILRNTRWCIGMVLYTGLDSKIVMNSGRTPSKRSRVERQMNPQVLLNLALLAAMSVVCAAVDAHLEQHYYPLQAYWMLGADRTDDNPNINGVMTLGNSLITFQNIVPISLYISLEAIRSFQAAFIFFDYEIYHDATDSPTLARSWNLSDDLGQIEYIFSDKTGTLTQNAMIFRQCSVGGKIYAGDPDQIDPEGTAPAVDVPDTHAESGAGAPPKTGEKPTSDDSTSSTVTAPNSGQAEDSGAAPAAPPRHRFVDSQLQNDLMNGESAEHTRALNGFFNVLALCHSVLAEQDKETGVITYKAQSPDEAALVQAAADVGFIFRGREKEILRLQTPFSDHLEEYELLNLLDFTSARKRMSVILRRLDEGGDGRIFLLCKGADNIIFERLKPGAASEELKEKTGQDLDFFAGEGLRTLCLAYKVINEDEYQSWATRYHDATVSLEDRDEKIEEVSNEIEQGLRLLGATAIEDKLQDGVPEAIADLKRAGIKVWVATGDKLETAIAIGHTTNLIARDSNLIIVRGGEYGSERSAYDQMWDAVDAFFAETHILDDPGVYPEGQDKATYESNKMPTFKRTHTRQSSLAGHDNGDRPGGFVLVIDGASLGHALHEEFSKELLLQLGMQCEAVICCRVSPKQKAQIVHLIKDGLGAMTLAIGDGANDVSMIQAADVGVGISGEEGLQAVNASDYAIARFRFLTRLLLVHGHWSYARNSNMIVNFFYKNIVCIGLLWWFQIYCGWSTTYIMEFTYLLFWNVFWSIFPVVTIGIFDREIDDDVLMKLPELYRAGREHTYFGMLRFGVYLFDGIMQSAIAFFFLQYTYDITTVRTDGYDLPMYEYSTVMVFAIVFIVNAYNGLSTSAWTAWVWAAILFGPIVLILYTLVYTAFAPGFLSTEIYGEYKKIFPAAFTYFGVLFVFCISILPRYIYKYVKFTYYPNDIELLRWDRKLNPNHDLLSDPSVVGNLPHYEPPGDDARSFFSSTSSLHETQSVGPRRSMQSGRPSIGGRPSFGGSRVDMSTGAHISSRGFDFSTEEGGFAIRRVQTHLSDRHQSRVSLPATVQSEVTPRRFSGVGTSLQTMLRKSVRSRNHPPPTASSAFSNQR